MGFTSKSTALGQPSHFRVVAAGMVPPPPTGCSAAPIVTSGRELRPRPYLPHPPGVCGPPRPPYCRWSSHHPPTTHSSSQDLHRTAPEMRRGRFRAGPKLTVVAVGACGARAGLPRGRTLPQVPRPIRARPRRLGCSPEPSAASSGAARAQRHRHPRCAKARRRLPRTPVPSPQPGLPRRPTSSGELRHGVGGHNAPAELHPGTPARHLGTPSNRRWCRNAGRPSGHTADTRGEDLL